MKNLTKTNGNGTAKMSKKTLIILICVISAVLVAGLSVGGYFLFRKKPEVLSERDASVLTEKEQSFAELFEADKTETKKIYSGDVVLENLDVFDVGEVKAKVGDFLFANVKKTETDDEKLAIIKLDKTAGGDLSYSFFGIDESNGFEVKGIAKSFFTQKYLMCGKYAVLYTEVQNGGDPLNISKKYAVVYFDDSQNKVVFLKDDITQSPLYLSESHVVFSTADNQGYYLPSIYSLGSNSITKIESVSENGTVSNFDEKLVGVELNGSTLILRTFFGVKFYSLSENSAVLDTKFVHELSSASASKFDLKDGDSYYLIKQYYNVNYVVGTTYFVTIKTATKDMQIGSIADSSLKFDGINNANHIFYANYTYQTYDTQTKTIKNFGDSKEVNSIYVVNKSGIDGVGVILKQTPKNGGYSVQDGSMLIYYDSDFDEILRYDAKYGKIISYANLKFVTRCFDGTNNNTYAINILGNLVFGNDDTYDFVGTNFDGAIYVASMKNSVLQGILKSSDSSIVVDFEFNNIFPVNKFGYTIGEKYIYNENEKIGSEYYIIDSTAEDGQRVNLIANYCNEFDGYLDYGLNYYFTKESGVYSIYRYDGTLLHSGVEDIFVFRENNVTYIVFETKDEQDKHVLKLIAENGIVKTFDNLNISAVDSTEIESYEEIQSSSVNVVNTNSLNSEIIPVAGSNSSGTVYLQDGSTAKSVNTKYAKISFITKCVYDGELNKYVYYYQRCEITQTAYGVMETISVSVHEIMRANSDVCIGYKFTYCTASIEYAQTKIYVSTGKRNLLYGTYVKGSGESIVAQSLTCKPSPSSNYDETNAFCLDCESVTRNHAIGDATKKSLYSKGKYVSALFDYNFISMDSTGTIEGTPQKHTNNLFARSGNSLTYTFVQSTNVGSESDEVDASFKKMNYSGVGTTENKISITAINGTVRFNGMDTGVALGTTYSSALKIENVNVYYVRKLDLKTSGFIRNATTDVDINKFSGNKLSMKIGSAIKYFEKTNNTQSFQDQYGGNFDVEFEIVDNGYIIKTIDVLASNTGLESAPYAVVNGTEINNKKYNTIYSDSQEMEQKKSITISVSSPRADLTFKVTLANASYNITFQATPENYEDYQYDEDFLYVGFAGTTQKIKYNTVIDSSIVTNFSSSVKKYSLQTSKKNYEFLGWYYKIGNIKFYVSTGEYKVWTGVSNKNIYCTNSNGAPTTGFLFNQKQDLTFYPIFQNKKVTIRMTDDVKKNGNPVTTNITENFKGQNFDLCFLDSLRFYSANGIIVIYERKYDLSMYSVGDLNVEYLSKDAVDCEYAEEFVLKATNKIGDFTYNSSTVISGIGYDSCTGASNAVAMSDGSKVNNTEVNGIFKKLSDGMYNNVTHKYVLNLYVIRKSVTLSNRTINVYYWDGNDSDGSYKPYQKYSGMVNSSTGQILLPAEVTFPNLDESYFFCGWAMGPKLNTLQSNFDTYKAHHSSATMLQYVSDVVCSNPVFVYDADTSCLNSETMDFYAVYRKYTFEVSGGIVTSLIVPKTTNGKTIYSSANVIFAYYNKDDFEDYVADGYGRLEAFEKCYFKGSATGLYTDRVAILMSESGCYVSNNKIVGGSIVDFKDC